MYCHPAVPSRYANRRPQKSGRVGAGPSTRPLSRIERAMVGPADPTDESPEGRAPSFLRSYLAHPSVVTKLQRLAAELDSPGHSEDPSIPLQLKPRRPRLETGPRR